jgi:hypothetical protein
LLMQKSNLREILLVFLIVLIAYGYFSSSPDWNTNSRLALVKAVVEEKRFEIDSYWNNSLETKDVAEVDGHYYSDKAIGASLIGAEFYYVFYKIYHRIWDGRISRQLFTEVITFLSISLICAFLAPFLYSFAKKITNVPAYSFIVTAAICLGTPLYKYSTVYYGHSLAGLFLFVVFFIWFNIKSEEQISPAKVLISGYFLGYAIITEYPTAMIAFCLGLYILHVLWKKQRLFDLKIYTCLIIGAAVPLIVAGAYNYVVFRHPFKTGYAYEMLSEFREGHHIGIMGIGWPNLATLFYMTFHTTMGIFWQSPALLLAFPGWFWMLKEPSYRAEAVLSIAIVLIYFLMMSGYYIWWGGSAFTPRNLIPVFPFFAIPLAFLANRWAKVAFSVLVLLSIIQMFIVSATSNYGITSIAEKMSSISMFSMFQQGSMIYDVYVPNFINQLLLPNRGQEFLGLEGFLSLVPFLVIEAVLIAGFIKTTSKSKSMTPQVET